MRITSFEYEDSTVGWKIDPIDFFPLTLLVGASGVGKTRILQSLLQMKKIALGASMNGIRWKVSFLIGDDACHWSGRFENKGFLPDAPEPREKDKPAVEKERLTVNGRDVILRDADGICFNGEKTVRLSPKESAVSLLREEAVVRSVHSDFSKILLNDGASIGFEPDFAFDGKSASMRGERADLNSIRNSDETLRSKLYLTRLYAQEEFERIKGAFSTLFPYVEDADIRLETLSGFSADLPVPRLRIREKGVGVWIDERAISSGMRRSFLHIAQLSLCADGTVVLIDEFENSLGINCLDEITDRIIANDRELQFIITSHHPYIINSIPPGNWKIVARSAGTVKNYDADQLNLSRSKHEAFTRLINIDTYAEGVEA